MQSTDIGSVALAEATAILGHSLPEDLGEPRVVVLPCDNMTAGVQDSEGPAMTLYERFLWRLFERETEKWDRYETYRDHHGDKNKIGEAIASVGRPVLILIDELMDYVRQLSDLALADIATRDMAFLRALLDAVNDVPNVALAVVMIASEKDTMDLDEQGTQPACRAREPVDPERQPGDDQ